MYFLVLFMAQVSQLICEYKQSLYVINIYDLYVYKFFNFK